MQRAIDSCGDYSKKSGNAGYVGRNTKGGSLEDVADSDEIDDALTAAVAWVMPAGGTLIDHRHRMEELHSQRSGRAGVGQSLLRAADHYSYTAFEMNGVYAYDKSKDTFVQSVYYDGDAGLLAAANAAKPAYTKGSVVEGAIGTSDEWKMVLKKTGFQAEPLL